jgi:hypothetical protein
MPPETSCPGSCHIMLGSVNSDSNMTIPGLLPTAEPCSLSLLKEKPVEPGSFYSSILPQAIQHIDF